MKIKIVTFFRHETKWSTQVQADGLLTMNLKAEPVFVAKNLDEAWVGVKG